MEIIIPFEVENVIKNLGNKTRKESAYKIYAALIKMSRISDRKGYFPVPSTFLQQINRRYAGIVNCFVENEIIEYDWHFDIDPITLDKIKRKRYSVLKKQCMRYRFKIDTTKGFHKDIKLDNFRKYRWYDLIKSSLDELGYKNQKISRVHFGRRVYYPLIKTYKKELKNKGLTIIDAKASHPRLLLLELQKKEIFDKNYDAAFAFPGGFYEYLKKNLKLKSDKKARKKFMYYLNGKSCNLIYGLHILFPKVSLFLNDLKVNNYKESAHYFQGIESKIWIDDLLNNIPVDFALPVHDSLIVKNEDLDKVLKYCKEKYPEIEFSHDKLKLGN